MTQLPLDAGAEHAHLRLTRELEPSPRRRNGRGSGRGDSAPDARSHARDLEQQLAGIRSRHRERESTLGVAPELVMVIETLGKAVSLAELVEKAELRVLGLVRDRALVAFSGDPELEGFRQRIDRYADNDDLARSGDPKHWYLLDPIVRIRPLEPEDVIDDDVLDRVREVAADQVVRVDIECWCTDELSDSRRRHDETKEALTRAGGQVLDFSCRAEQGISLIRADLPAGHVTAVASTDRVSRISLIPRPVLDHVTVRMWPIDALPVVLSPRETAATVAIIDSGIRAGHPLLDPVTVEAVSAVPGLTDGSDEHGHGSMVASLALYGSLEQELADRTPLRPAGYLLGIRVLNEDNEFPDDTLWQNHLESAVDYAIKAGARVINLSLGDASHPYRAPAPSALGTALDTLIRDSDAVLVVSSGNVHPEDHSRQHYAAQLLQDPRARIAPPAMSSLALTVGALVPDEWQGVRPVRESVENTPLGKPGEPSPLSRTGPGVEFAIKPELTAPGGTYIYDRLSSSVKCHQSSGNVVGVDGANPERLLDLDVGTSFSAPLVSHAVLRVFGRYPWLSANAARALVLASAIKVPTVIDHESAGKAQRAQLHLSGFGRVDADRAETSDEYRVVLLADESVTPDQVHFYEVPVPDSFYRPGNKQLTVALAFNPEVRGSRLKYLSSRMSVFAYRGRSVDGVKAKYAASGGDAPDDLGGAQIDLFPADRDRLLGANQAASAAWTNSWNVDHDNLIIVVRNSTRWLQADDLQRYALAVVLEVDPASSLPIYHDLRAQFEAITEIETEVEISY